MAKQDRVIDLNCDMGESFASYKLGFDEEVIKYITSANVAAGFDVLGFALDGVGDRVSVSPRASGTGIVVEKITGVVTDLPSDPARNTASVALAALFADRGVEGACGC